MSNNTSILIVEDERNTLNGLKEILVQEGYKVYGALSAEAGWQQIIENEIDLVLTDMMLPGMDGMDLSKKLLKDYPEIQIVIMTAYGTVKSAVKAMREGVYNYITKPIDLDELLVTIDKAVGEKVLKQENIDLKSKVNAKYQFENIIGRSGPIIEVFEKVMKVAKSNSTVIVRGESGTGKELIARAIHNKSNRGDKPFVEINCSSFPDTLLESELFGYEKGAFTGAYKTKIGRIEAAEGGTIFLDEIGDINGSVQVRLLRVLQEKTISKLGSTTNTHVDIRLIAATNANLENYIKEGKFREDLYYRLNVIPLHLPPLRKRKADIPLLVNHFVEKYAKENEKSNIVLSEKSLDILIKYNWPGNVRELENAIENAIVMADDSLIIPDDLPIYINTNKEPSSAITLLDDEWDYSIQLENSEKQIIEKALHKTKSNKTKAAELLGISLRTMRYKVKKYGL